MEVSRLDSSHSCYSMAWHFRVSNVVIPANGMLILYNTPFNFSHQ